VDQEGALAQRLRAAGHGGGHLDDDRQILLPAGGEKDRFGRVLHHRPAQATYMALVGTSPGRPKEARKSISAQVGHPGGVDHVLQPRGPDLAGLPGPGS
jgi:hypothetical protein